MIIGLGVFDRACVHAIVWHGVWWQRIFLGVMRDTECGVSCSAEWLILLRSRKTFAFLLGLVMKAGGSGLVFGVDFAVLAGCWNSGDSGGIWWVLSTVCSVGDGVHDRGSRIPRGFLVL